MISIIISTYKPDFLAKISENISRTIGIEYEIIPIVNHKKYSLCQAYNLGESRAKYPYLCFVHEDVIFLKNNWGKRLTSLMAEDKTIGLIGVAGTKFKSTYPTVGWGTGPYVKNLYRGIVYLNDQLKFRDFDLREDKKDIEDVVSLDGLFLFTRKEVYNKCKFDESMLTGFHGYDTDYSLQVFFQNYRVIIDRKLEVIHYSLGAYNLEYAAANRLIKRKWSLQLPVATADLNLTKVSLWYLNATCWAGYLRNMIIRKLNLPFEPK